MQRKHLPLKQKLAAALYELAKVRLAGLVDDDGVMSWRHQLSADQVNSKFHFDHVEFHSHGGKDLWANLDPLLVKDHREKTRRDLGIIAKGKRLQRKEARHKAAMAMKGNHEA